jgi:hypothetical protein
VQAECELALDGGDTTGLLALLQEAI